MAVSPIEAYIRQAAAARGIDADIAVRVAKSEGGVKDAALQSYAKKNGVREPSYGPFQLLVGGGNTGFPTGMGNAFFEATGLDPSDPKNVQAGIDFALDHAAKNGWGAWYGAKNSGIGKWAGIGGGDGGGNELAFAASPKETPAESAVNAMAAGTLHGVPANPVQTVAFVPPPFSNQQGNFTPLVSNEPPAAPAPAQTPEAAPQPPAAEGDGSDVLKAWGLDGSDQSQAPTDARQPATTGDDALIKAWGLDKTDAAPAAAVANADEKAPTATPIGLNDAVRSVATGVPVIGGVLNNLNAATNALVAPLVNPMLSDENQLKGDTWSERYANSLAEQEGMDKAYAEQHPIANTVGNIVGGVASTVPMVAMAPGLMGASGTASLRSNMLLGGLTGGGIGAADSAIRSGGDVDETLKGGGLGLAFGGLSPAAGKVIGAGANKLLSTVSGMTARGAAAKSLQEAMAASGKTVDDIAFDMGRNNRLTAMDLDPNLQQIGMNLANQGGAPRSILNQAVETRMAGAKGAVDDAFDSALGESPDTVRILGDLRAKQNASVMTPDQVRENLDNAMGPATDPQGALDALVKQRSTESGPLYEKAFEGGSMAPLEKQFEGAFSQATNAVTKASQDLAAARQQQLLANADVSKAGNNVYASSGAGAASRDANAAVKAAEQNLATANAQKESVLSRLRKAQEDGSANAPGAVWNPRIQQFLDDPIAQAGLAKGANIQRLEALAEGKPFNPTEYAITDVDEAGNPIVGSVPNMRTLNVVKKGLDSMVEAAKDPLTGRLSEEGVAIDKVRRAFLGELDSVNADYKAARAAWEGPSKVREAFTKGLSLFSNGKGKAGLANTPEQIEAWISKASPDEVQALKMGARSSLEQEMANSANQVDRVARLTDIEANQKKLSALIGKDEAKKVIDGLKAQHTDPVGDAFSRGLDILRTRTGSAGLEDRPEFWREWFSGASAAEKDAAKQGARVAIDTQINAVRSAAAKGASIPDVGFNRERLEILLGKAETDKLAQTLADEQKIAQTNAKLFAGSQTAPRQATNKLTDVKEVTPGISLTTPMAIGGGYSVGGIPGAAAGAALSVGRMGVQAAQRARDIARNRLIAEAIVGNATKLRDAVSAGSSIPQIARSAQMGTNLLLTSISPTAVNQLTDYRPPNVPVNVPAVPKRPLEITVTPNRLAR